MPKHNLTAEQQLNEMRAGLLSPRALFAKVQEQFKAGAVCRNAAHRLVSAGDPDSLKTWVCDDGLKVLARTKSEARAAWKRATGKVVPPKFSFFRKA